APNRLVSKDFEEITLDGVTMVFQNAPDTEAPVQLNTYFPQFKAFWAAEVITGTIHNIYTTRGAAVHARPGAGSARARRGHATLRAPRRRPRRSAERIRTTRDGQAACGASTPRIHRTNP